MCKRIYVILVAIMMVGVAFAQEMQDPAQGQNAQDSLGIHPWNMEENNRNYVIPDQSHWSMYLGAGFNVFDGDYTSEKKNIVWFPTLSLGGAYHWNNTWALGAEYKFRQYKVDGAEGHADVMLKGMSHQANFYISFDVFNAFRPQNTRKIFALDLILGGGAIWKKNSIYYQNVYKDSITTDFWFRNISKSQEPMSDPKYKLYGVFLGGVSAEFNINRSLQLGLRGIYNYTTTDQIEGRPRANNNDGFFDCELLLRYKFAPRKKSNVRNFMKESMLCKNADANRGGGRDTLYIITRDTVYMMPAEGAALATAATNDSKEIRNYVVFFENDVPELDKVALSTAGEAAISLKQNTEYQAVVIGSCDNTGAVEYNQWLAVQRANNVTRTLVDMGVNVDRIYTVGRGIMQDDRAEGSYSVNRRVEIQLVNDAELAKAKEDYAYFEQYKNVKKGSAVRQAGEGKYASSSEALKAAIKNMKETGVAAPIADVVNALMSTADEPVQQKPDTAELDSLMTMSPREIPVDALDTVVVVPNMTLSKLARKYYGNGNMWVKIFEANRDVLASPDHLEDGMILVIPKK